MKKLNKENIYINLQGKSEEELTDINNILDYFKQVKRRDNITEYFNECYDCFNYLHFYNNEWLADTDFFYLKEKQEVTIQQLKEILQPMGNKEEQLRKEAKERGYTHDNFKCLINRKCEGIKDIENWFYEIFEDTLYTNTEGEGGNVVYKDGVWAEFKETLEQQLEKAKAEVKRLEDEIEESKIKVGDWVVINETKSIFKVKENDLNWSIKYCQKITDQELINKLNSLIK